MCADVRVGSWPTIRSRLTLRNLLTGAESIGENIVTIQGLERAAFLLFHAIDVAEKDGQQADPNLAGRDRFYNYIHCGDGTDVTPDIDDIGLQRYLIDDEHPTKNGGASGALGWKDTLLTQIAGGFRFRYEAEIHWSSSSADTSITEWCIGSAQDYVHSENFNHGTINFYLTGKSSVDLTVDCLW